MTATEAIIEARRRIRQQRDKVAQWEPPRDFSIEDLDKWHAMSSHVAGGLSQALSLLGGMLDEIRDAKQQPTTLDSINGDEFWDTVRAKLNDARNRGGWK